VTVVDASALLELLLGTSRGARVEVRLLDPNETLHAPHLIDLEVTQVLRRYVLAHDLSVIRAGQALDDFLDLPLLRYPHYLILPRIWQLRHNLTAYDAAYVALAEVLKAPLVTCDGNLADAPGHGARIELL
jgi:predicted nucleic acid-binding protein